MTYLDTHRVLLAVHAEREDQDDKWGEQHYPDGTDGLYSADRDLYRTYCDAQHRAGNGTWRDIALEEFYEALSETDPVALRKELVQAAAVLVAWIEDIDSRKE